MSARCVGSMLPCNCIGRAGEKDSCRDSLLKSSSESFNLGLELEVIEEQNEVGKSEEEYTKDEGHK